MSLSSHLSFLACGFFFVNNLETVTVHFYIFESAAVPSERQRDTTSPALCVSIGWYFEAPLQWLAAALMLVNV